MYNMLFWRCKKCKSEQTSNSQERHKMDYCECKETAVDHEENYTRIIGDNFEEMNENELEKIK